MLPSPFRGRFLPVIGNRWADTPPSQYPQGDSASPPGQTVCRVCVCYGNGDLFTKHRLGRRGRQGDSRVKSPNPRAPRYSAVRQTNGRQWSGTFPPSWVKWAAILCPTESPEPSPHRDHMYGLVVPLGKMNSRPHSYPSRPVTGDQCSAQTW